MPSLEPPEDESIRTLYVGGLDARVTEQDLRDNFYAHGEIELVRMVLQRACAFVTYTTREGAEKAAEELSNKLVIKGLRLKLMWGRPQAPKPESEGSEVTARQVAHSGMLPRAVISQQQQGQMGPPYYNVPLPPPPQSDRAYYPSMDPQRMGALVSTQEGSSSIRPGESSSGPSYQGMPPPMPQGQYYPHHYYPPPYGYMPPPPYQQQPYMPPQQYQHPAPVGSALPPPLPSGSGPSGATEPGQASSSSSGAGAGAGPGPGPEGSAPTSSQ
ncbi:hypothetical protein SAY86_027272 [Trapa natans]|uniref:RRM domain-containing protein n=1 Tax=Trapa natans TaxID=22666 RepID=A0AAN7KM44_TRANT|nr:hypothetical protein SAY86_027272 [Trapa natans]